MRQNKPPSNTTNPYFDPDPTWLFLVMKVEFIVSFLSVMLGYYLILYKSPVYNSKTFKRFLLYHMTIGLLFEADYCVLSPVLVSLPYPAGQMSGFFSFIRMPKAFQAAILVQLVVSVSTALCPLFYYRMNAIISQNHFLKKKLLKYLVYVTVYIISYLIPIPLVLLAINYRDQYTIKLLLFEKFHVICNKFWDEDTLAYYPYDNPWAAVVTFICIPAIIGSLVIIFGSTYVIYHTLKTKTSLSVQTKHHHKYILRSLISLMLVLGSVFVIFIPYLMYSLLVGHSRADIANIAEAIAGIGFPFAVWAYIFTYSPYRRALIQLIWNKDHKKR